MPLKWRVDLETGYSEIDNQHKRLFAALRDLMDAVKEKKSKEEVFKLLTFAEDYFSRHAEMEEALMETFAYPGLAAHRAEHAELHEELLHIREMYKKNGNSLLITIKLQTITVRWLHEHIKHVDKPMVAFLKAAPR
jgi:hemerythrin